MRQLFFTSDLHLGHKNVIGFTNRPFLSIEEMNERLIKNINKTVGYNDDLYILGDVAYRANKGKTLDLLKSINCRHLHLILGNHDKDYSNDGIFESIDIYKEIEYDENQLPLVLFHYEIKEWNRKLYGAIHLHGHIHSIGSDHNIDNFRAKHFAYDVGVDANNYCPVSLEEILMFKKIYSDL